MPAGFADLSRASAIKRVSAAAHRILVDASGIADGSPTPRPRCCVSTVLRKGARGGGDGTAESARGASRGCSRTTEEEDATPGSAFLVSAAWLRAWRAWKTGPMPSAVGMGPTRGLACAHGRLRPDAKAVAVPADAWSRLRAEVSENGDDVCSPEEGVRPRIAAPDHVPDDDEGGFRTGDKRDDDDDVRVVAEIRGSERGCEAGAPGYPAPRWPPPRLSAPALALARVSRVVLGGVRGMRGGARGDRRGEERTGARSSRRTERRALRCFAAR